MQKAHGPLPGKPCCRGLIAGGRVVVKAVLRPGVRERFVFYARGLERGLVSRPRRVNALVAVGEVDEEPSPDTCDLLGRRRDSVKRNRRSEPSQPRRKEIGDAAAVTEPNDAELAAAPGQARRGARSSYEVFMRL